MDAVDSSGLVIPVSVWSYKLSDSSVPVAAGRRRRRLFVLEPVSCITTRVTFDRHVSVTVILSGDCIF